MKRLLNRIGLLIMVLASLSSIGCHSVDRLTGGDSDEETCAKMPWICGNQTGLKYDEEFCNRYPSLDVCGGDQGGFRTQAVGQ